MPFNALFSYLIKKRLQQIDLFRSNPHEAQQEVFHNLIQSARYTEWGKQHGYTSISNVDQFQERVPLQDYDDVKVYVERLRKGEQNLLWPTDIKWFAKSSGTTSDKSKYIPVSREALEDCHYKGGKDLLALHYEQFPNSKLYKGKSMMVGGSSITEMNRSDAYSGDLSAIIIKNLPTWVEVKKTPVRDIALLGDWEVKVEEMARSTMNEDVHSISGVPSWTLIILKRVLELKKADNILEVWPDLELYMHGGVSFRPYREQFRQLIPSATMNYLESYNASEGFFGIQDQHNSEDLLLMLDYGIFFEFVPLAELGKEQPRTCTLNEVKAGQQYAIVISTNAGLWRYMPGDTVIFTSVDPFRIRVSGRTKSFINAFGEELIVDNAERALQHACTRTGSAIAEYTAGPIYMQGDSLGGHEWIIEFEKEPEELDRFIAFLDEELMQVNSDYEAKRRGDMALKLPVVHAVPRGTFYEWMRTRGKLGGQNKVPRLANDRKFLDEILGATVA